MKKKRIGTPVLGGKILRLIWSESEAESISGDYEVIYQHIYQTKGPLSANLWYWLQIARSAAESLSVRLYWSIALLRSNIRFTRRTVKRNKGYSLIIVLSLAVGLAVCVFIVQWIQYEKSYDRFHPDVDQLYRLTVRRENLPPDQGTYAVPGPAAAFLKTEYPEVLDATRFCPLGKILLSNQDNKFFAECAFVDPSFLKMFFFPLLRGNADMVLSQPLSMVITDNLAKKFFGRDDPTGKTITMSYQGRTVGIEVTGVIQNPPPNTHLQFDFLLPYALAPASARKWDTQWPFAYLKISKSTSLEEFDTKIAGVLKDHSPEWSSRLGLHSLSESHINSIEGQKLSRYITIFSTLGIFILLMACVNFINLTTARGTTRLKEIGVKKILGSSRRQLIGQILTESLSFSLVALLLSSILILIVHPYADLLLGKPIEMSLSWPVALILIGVTLLTGLVSGIVPAFLFSSFRLQDVLKRGFVSGNFLARGLSKGLSPGLLMRRILAAFQLTLMITFIIAVVVIQNQMNFILHKDLGLARDHVITLSIPNEITRRYDAFKSELLTNPDILGVTGIGSPVMHRSNFQLKEWEGVQHPKVNCGLSWVDCDFAKTFNIDVTEGRFFSPEFASDMNTSYVANEALIRAMGVKEPIGTKVRFNATLGTVIGVVKDFHIESLHREIRPHLLILPPKRHLRYFYVRIKPGEIPATLGFIEKKINDFSPNYPFDYHFFSEEVEGFYKNERLTHRLTGAAMVIAVLISSLALFGLIAYTTERRTKEIGIRKVLGASTGNIFSLLTKEFVILVMLANVLAWPAAFFVMRRWMDNFAYRTSMGVFPFLLAGGTGLAITLLTIGMQALKGAAAEPVDSLRYE